MTCGAVVRASRMDEIVDATWLTSLQRTVKSPAELELLREAARISDAGMQAGLALVAGGPTEIEMVAAAESAILARGAELAFTTVAGSGERTSSSTFLPTARTIGEGDLVVLDLGARVGGYHGDMCRAVVRSRPDAAQRRLLETAEWVARALAAHMRGEDLRLGRFLTARENLRRLAEAGPGVGVTLTPVPGSAATVSPARKPVDD